MLKEVTGIHNVVPVDILRYPYTVFCGLEVGEQDRTVRINYETADNLVPFFCQKVYDVLVMDSCKIQGYAAEFVILGEGDLKLGAVIVIAVYIPELAVRYLQIVVKTLLERRCWLN